MNFRLVAVIESLDEPWFEDARVKTAVTILQRTSDEDRRDNNVVRFVRLFRPLADIMGVRSDEAQRQAAAEKLRDLILRTNTNFANRSLRIFTKRQGDLWNEGLSVAQMFARQKAAAQHELGREVEDDEQAEIDPDEDISAVSIASDYGGGKWGRYLRAPDFYFDVMRDFGSRFVRLGDVATIKRGITSGCDAFFMPRNVTRKLLSDNSTELEWQNLPLMTRCARRDASSGKVVIIQCGDGTLHPIESEFVTPEVHSLMSVDRPIVEASDLGRVALWVDKPLKDLKGTLAHRYITWGSKQTFASRKSKAVPVPLRATCAARPIWYDLTGRKPGIGFWPKAQQYRHIVPANSHKLACNCNLYDIHGLELSPFQERALIPVLNSTLIALFKPFYGRYAGTEGNLKTEVVDSLLLEIPDPRLATKAILQRMERALASMQKRDVTHLVERRLLDCHTADEVRDAAKLPLQMPEELQQQDRRELDDAVFELLGVDDADRRRDLIDLLYREVALHFRAIRIVEVQKMEQRRQGGSSRDVSAQDLAADAWGELEGDLRVPLSSWLAEFPSTSKTIQIPDGPARLPDESHFFEANTVFFGSKPAVSVACDNREQAELVYAVATAGLRGPVLLPIAPEACREVAGELSIRLSRTRDRLQTLAESRAGSEKTRAQVFDLLYRWAIDGRQSELTPMPS
jgi:hypothetical protein